MGCCVSREAGNEGRRRRSPVKPPPPTPSSQTTHLPRPRAAPYAPPEEETVVKEVLSETPLPKRNSPEVREAANTLNLRLQDEAPETKILISKLEAAAEIVSEYSEMCSAASESLSTATTTATATDKRDYEVTSGEHGEPRRQQRMNAASSRSPVKQQRKRPSAGVVRTPQSHSRSPARRAQAARPELRGERKREFSGELRARQRNAESAGRGAGGGSRRSSRSPAPAARRDGGGNKPGGAMEIPPLGAQSGRSGRSREPGRGAEDMDGEGREKTAEETDGATVSEQGNRSLIDNPHVSLECFIFL